MTKSTAITRSNQRFEAYVRQRDPEAATAERTPETDIPEEVTTMETAKPKTTVTETTMTTQGLQYHPLLRAQSTKTLKSKYVSAISSCNQRAEERFM